jgi:hypothetical protein
MVGVFASNQDSKDTRFQPEGVPFCLDWRFQAALQAGCFGLSACSFNTVVSGGSYIDVSKFQCPENGTTDSIRIQTYGTKTNARMRMAVYADNAGYPGALLWEGVTKTWIAGGWISDNTISGSISLVGGNYYWLAKKDSAITPSPYPYLCYEKNQPVNWHYYKAGYYFGQAYPNPFPSGGSTNTNEYDLQLCYTPTGGVVDTYSGRGIGRGVTRGVMR